MESRILYLEKELSLVRKKLSLLENNIQNDMKNYIDQYMQVYFEQLNINIQSNENEESPERKLEHGKLRDIKTSERAQPNISNIKHETNNDIKLKDTLVEEVEDLNDNLKEEYEDTKTWSDVSQDGNQDLEYVIIEDDNEDGSIVVELDEDDEEMQTGEFDQNEEYSEGFNVVGYDGTHSFDDSESELQISNSVSVSKSPYIPKILSMARDIVPAAPTPSSSKTSLKENARYPFKCQICLEVFKCASHFEKHKIKHVSDRPFKCELCDKAYKRSHHLKEHQTLSHPTEKHKILETGRNYRCLKCPKMFTRPSLLTAHMKTHSKEEKGVRQGIETVIATNNTTMTMTMTPQFHGFTLNL